MFDPHIGWKWEWCSLTKTAPIPVFGSTLIGDPVSGEQDDSAQDRPVSVHHDRVYSARDFTQADGKHARWATTRFSTLNIAGVSTNQSLILAGKGTGSVLFPGRGRHQHSARRSGGEFRQLRGGDAAVTTGSPALGAVGSDTNIDCSCRTGAGLVRFGTHTGSADVACKWLHHHRDAAGNAPQTG